MATKPTFKNSKNYSISVPRWNNSSIDVPPEKFVVGDYYNEYNYKDGTITSEKIFEVLGLTDVSADPDPSSGDVIYEYVITSYIPNEPGGLATLDATGKLDLDQLPQLAISSTSVVADQAARLALTAEIGDVAIQQDTGLTYILAASPATDNANWKVLAATNLNGSGTANEIPYWINSTTLGTTGIKNVSGHLSWNEDVGLKRDSAGVVKVTDGSTGLGQIRANSADFLGTPPGLYHLLVGTTGTAYLYVKTNGVTYLHNTLNTNSTGSFNWTSTVDENAAADTGLARSSAGVVKVTNGSTGIGALLSSVVVTPNTGTATPTATDSKTVYTNANDADGSTINLPTAVAGLEYSAVVTDAQTITINANTGDYIRLGSNLSSAAGNISSNTVGSVVRLVAVDDTTWVAVSIVGTWSIS